MKKASNALREKKNWSCMRKNKEQDDTAASDSEATVDGSTAQKMAASDATKNSTKRNAVDAEGSSGKQSTLVATAAKKVKSESSSTVSDITNHHPGNSGIANIPIQTPEAAALLRMMQMGGEDKVEVVGI